MARTAPQPTPNIIPRDPRQPVTAEMMVALRDRWPNGERLNIAWRLAKDIDTLEALLAGQPVDPARIHAHEMQRALEPRLIQLVRPIDLLTAA